MKTPTFSIIGGKSRLRGWLINLFPKEGRIYVEPFSGRGNVFFKAKQELDFHEWHVNDICGDFLHALLKTDLQTLPSTIQDKKSWDKWKKKAEEGDPRGHLLEPEVTWGGKGWPAGVKGFTTKGGHPPYNREKFIPRAEMARELLLGDNVKITSNSWELLPWGEYSHQDFVYLDPPYHEVTDYYCKQVDHEALLSMLASAPFRWAISGYETKLYAKKLSNFRKASTGRNSEIKGSNTGKKEPVMEFLWMNY